MVTEYNLNVIMRRRLEAEKAAEELKNSGAVKTAETKPAEAVNVKEPVEASGAEAKAVSIEAEKPVEAVEVKKTETVRPKKSDAEKLRKGKK